MRSSQHSPDVYQLWCKSLLYPLSNTFRELAQNQQEEVAMAGSALSISAVALKSVHQTLQTIDGVDKSLLIARLDTIIESGDHLAKKVSSTL